MYRSKVITSSGIDWSLPNITYVLSTANWTTFQNGPGGSQTFYVGFSELRTYSNENSLIVDHEYGAERIWSAEDYLILPGRSYTWDVIMDSVHSTSGETEYHPRNIHAEIWTYTDYAGTTGGAMIDEIVENVSPYGETTYSRTVVLPAGTKSVKQRFWSTNQYTSQVTGVGWKDNSLTLIAS